MPATEHNLALDPAPVKRSEKSPLRAADAIAADTARAVRLELRHGVRRLAIRWGARLSLRAEG